MAKLLITLRCDSPERCSRNIWLSFGGFVFVIGISYQAWVVSEWLFLLAACMGVGYSLASLYGYAYWLVCQWHGLGVNTKVAGSFYWLFLGIINAAYIGVLVKMGSLAIR